MKNLIIGLMTVPFLATPALAESEYMRGYTEGLNAGNFIAYCVSYNAGNYSSVGRMRTIVRHAYDSMDAANRQWAREEMPECVF